MQIPQVDLRRQHEPLAAEIEQGISRAIANGAFVGGPEVDGFESEFAEYLGAAGVVGVSSGTAALHLALRALNLRAEDEVILPANTFIATAEAVVLAGATPVFCDVDPDTALMCRASVEQVLTDNTRVLIPVHLYGHMVNMDPLLDLAEERGLFVVEDAAQAHGARYHGAGEARRAGAIGHLGCFSFYPTKNLGAIGEGGAVSCCDETLAKRVRVLRDHGQEMKHVHEVVGDNARLHSIQAFALRVKLPHLDTWNARRVEIASRYLQGVQGLPLAPITQPTWSESVYHQFVVRASDRKAWQAALGEQGVSTGIHYPTPVHLQPAFASHSAGKGSCPVSEELCATILSLPMFADLTLAETDHVVKSMRAVAESSSVSR